MNKWKFHFLLLPILFTQISYAEIKLDLPQSGWHNMPSIFRPYLDYNSSGLSYNADSKYLREFRREFHTYSYTNYEYVNWDKIGLTPETPAEIKKCWGIFISGGSCGASVSEPLAAHFSNSGELDLLKYSRYISDNNGLTVARDVLVKKLTERDASQGEARRRIMYTTQDKSKVYPDSLANLPMEERKEIGIYFALGIGGEKSPNAALIFKAAERLAQMGFQSEMLKVDPELGSNHNALMLKDMLADRVPKLKKVVFIAASKGVADFITYFLNYGNSLALEDRQKVKLMVSLSGVIRPSIVAQYLISNEGMLPSVVGASLTATGQSRTKQGVRSLAMNPWINHDPRTIKQLFPNLTWLSLPAIPEGIEGVTHLSMWEGFLKTPTYRNSKEASPMDGLVESAASVLPPDTGLTEWIVPIFGPHAMALGSYSPSLRVAPIAQKDHNDKVIPEAGAEILDAVFRALPQTLLDDSK